jgi:hypothetical protein
MFLTFLVPNNITCLVCCQAVLCCYSIKTQPIFVCTGWPRDLGSAPLVIRLLCSISGITTPLDALQLVIAYIDSLPSGCILARPASIRTILRRGTSHIYLHSVLEFRVVSRIPTVLLRRPDHSVPYRRRRDSRHQGPRHHRISKLVSNGE